ncbi:MAG: hypothetical protein KKH06_00070, partial [Gammaproteobacteria bacterium]|nr:hypothetical protein [Gammaproteobacteria bacterium]
NKKTCPHSSFLTHAFCATEEAIGRLTFVRHAKKHSLGYKTRAHAVADRLRPKQRSAVNV